MGRDIEQARDKPLPAEQPSLVGASHAFIGGRLNLAHAAAIYLPADVMARLGARFGRPSLLATGLDVHGRRAGRELRAGADPAELADRAESVFRSDLALLYIYPDIFLRTDDPTLADLTAQALAVLTERKLLEWRPSITFHCRGCNDDLSVRELRRGDGGAFLSHADAAAASGDCFCVACGTEADRHETEQLALLLPRPPALADLHASQPGKVARKLLAAQQDSDFQQWEISRDDYHGLPVQGAPGKSLYVWFPALVSKVLLAKAAGVAPSAFFASDQTTLFFGKNIVNYYGLVLPALLHGWLDIQACQVRFCVRGFCDLVRSAPLLDIERAVADHGADAIRFFCLYSAPDDALDFTLEHERLSIVTNSVLARGFGRYLAAARERLIAEADDADALVSRPDDWALFDRLHRDGHMRRLLLELERFARAELKDIAHHGPARLRSGYHAVYDLLSAYVPTWIRQYAIPESSSAQTPRQAAR